MADYFDAPAGPPPPKAPEVPAGWTARWNDQYKEWFYVNLYTKQSQWDKPTEPAHPPHEESSLGAPPGYAPGNTPLPTDTKKNPYDDVANQTPNLGQSSYISEDERLARQLQAEEEARVRSAGGPGAASGYGASPIPGYQQSSSPYPQQSSGQYSEQLPPRDKGGKSGGFLGKLLGKAKLASAGGGSHGSSGYGGYPQQQGYGHSQGYGGYPQQQHGGGFMGMGGSHGGGYGGHGGGYGGHGGGYGGHGGGYGGYPSNGRKQGGGGMGMAGGAALGLGAGVIGGVLVADAINDGQEDAYQDGYQDGDDGGGDFGGGDDGGGE